MKQLFKVLLILTLVIGLNNEFLRLNSQINKIKFSPEKLREQHKFMNVTTQDSKENRINNATGDDYAKDNYEKHMRNIFQTHSSIISMLGVPIAYLTGNYSDKGLDLDDDGRYDRLVIEVEVNVTQSGNRTYYLDLRLTLVQEGRDFFERIFPNLYFGINTVPVPFKINFLYSRRLNSSYRVNHVTLGYVNKTTTSYIPTDRVFSSIYTTRIYNYTEFDPPKAFLMNNYNDRGLDTNGDGRFDQLIIDLEINFTKSGEYQVKLELEPSGEKSAISRYWDKGINNVSVPFDTYGFYGKQESSHHKVEYIRIEELNWNLLDYAYQPYITRVYNFTEFDIDFIAIDGLEHFLSLIREENWPGEGTSLNPYIIEGITINGSYGKFLISISRTNVHFHIRNCTLMSGEIGLYLSNVKNGIISHNTFQNTYDAIKFEFADNNIITCNTINTNYNGISVESNNNTIAKNIIFSNKKSGIILQKGSKNNIIRNNAIYNNRENGIYLGEATKNTITKNMIVNNHHTSIALGSKSQSNLIEWNDFKNNPNIVDYGRNNAFFGNYWYEWENNKSYIPISGNGDSNLQSSPNHLSKPRVLFPNGGEIMMKNILIDWVPAKDELEHDITYSVYYSSNNGSTWFLLGTKLSTTSFRWEVRNVSIGSAFLVKVTALDSFGFETWDTSDQSFTFNPQPPPTLHIRVILFLLLCSFLFIVIGYNKYSSKKL